MHDTKRRAILAALLASTTIATPALAQEAAQEDTNEIVVTAQKREQNLQDVPISMQALGTQKLDELNISNFEEYTQLLPSVAFQTVEPGATVVYMRGVASGGDGNHSGSLPSVGSYLDEQPVTTIGGTLDIHIYDVARIESLSGPQGTLYGASSQAGTIRIITNKPDVSAFYGRVDSELNLVEHGGVGGTLEGMINVPISQSAAFRASAFYQRDAGFIDNVPGTRTYCGTPTFDAGGDVNGCNFDGISVDNDALVKKDQNEIESWGGRAALKVDLDDVWTVTPQVMYQEMRSSGRYSYDPSVGDLQVQRFLPDNRRERFIQAALTIEGELGNWDMTYAGAYMDRTTASLTDYTDYADAYDVAYVNLRDDEGNFVCNGLAGCFYYQDAAGATIDPRQLVEGSDHFRKLSQEFRVSSPQSDRFRITAGLFYQRQSNLIHQNYIIDGLAPDLSVNGWAGTLWLTRQERVDKDYAMFGEASFDIAPNLTLTAGGRAFIYDNSLIGFFGFGRNPGVREGDGRAYTVQPHNAAGSSNTGVARCFATDGLPLRNPNNVSDPSDPDYSTDGESVTRVLLPGLVDNTPCTNLGQYVNGAGVIPVDAQGSGFTHKINLTYKPTEDVLFYGTWSRGFRPGGINRRADVPAYDPDYLTNYEFGWKTTWLDGMLRFNGAIYQQEWDKFQFSFLGPNSFTIILNGPNARIRGVEMDAGVNTGGLSLNVAGSYTDAKTRNNLCEVADPTFSCSGEDNSILAPAGTRLPITPQFKISGTARYSFDLGKAKSYVQAVASHQSSASSDVRVADAATVGRLEAYQTVSLSAGADFDTFSLDIFVSNLFDERGQLSRFVACGLCSRPYIVPIQPRTFGIRAGAKF